MSTGIVIVGANGRMGRTISGLAAADPEYRLAGLVDSKEHLDALSGASCPVSDDLEALLPRATITILKWWNCTTTARRTPPAARP